LGKPGGMEMPSHRTLAVLLLIAGASGWPGATAQQPPARVNVLRLEQPEVVRAGHSAPAKTPALPWLPPLPSPVPEAPGAEAPPSAPQPYVEEALTLEDLNRMALENNPTMVQARMVVRAAEGRYVQAGLYPNPVVGYAGGDMGLEGTSGQQGGILGQEFVTSGKLRKGRAVAAYEIQQARHGLEMQTWRVLTDVRSGYYEVLMAQKMIEINEELLRIGNEGQATTEKLQAAGEVSRVDVLQARIEAEQAKLGLVQARNDYRTAWRRLASVVGQPQMQPAPLAGDPVKDLPELSFEDALAQLMGQSPELSRAQAGVERAKAEVALQCAERVPNVEVGLWVKQDASVQEGLADVEVAMPLPIFNRNQGGIMEARAGLVAAHREVQRVELALEHGLADAFGVYVNARRRVEAYTGRILPDARESLKLVSDNYPEQFGYLELLTAQRTFFSVNLEYLTALQELWARSIEIEGLLLSGSLEPVE